MNKHDLNYTLLFGGGAIRGVAYCGVLKALDEIGVNYSTVAGSSVGSVIAGLLAVGYNAEEIQDIMMSVNFELFKDIQLAIGPQFALSKGGVFYEWLKDLVEKKVYGDDYKKGTHKAVTFSDIDKNLVIITTDLSNFECKEFSKITTPDFEIAKAIRISCGMPGLMQPVEYNNRMLVDGDLQKSAPMWSLTKTLQPEDERIMEIRLEGDFQGTDKNAVEFLNAIYSYATRTGTKFLIDLYGMRDKFDYVVIDTGDLNIVDFNLSSKKREALVDSGYKQTVDYFNNYLMNKKRTLRSIYEHIYVYLKKCEKDVARLNIPVARAALGDLYIELCDNVELINPADKKLLDEFKICFMANIKTPALFGKTKLNNEKLVISKLQLCINAFENRIHEYSDYIG